MCVCRHDCVSVCEFVSVYALSVLRCVHVCVCVCVCMCVCVRVRELVTQCMCFDVCLSFLCNHLGNHEEVGFCWLPPCLIF